MSSFLTIDTEKEKDTLKDGGSGMFFPKSDIYKLTLDTVRLRITEANARQVDIKVANDSGRTQYLMYAFILDKNSGGEIQFQVEKFKKMCLVCGISSVDMPETESRMWIDFSKKADTLQDMDVFTQFDNQELYAKVTRRYSQDKDGTIRENYLLDNFYRASDKASAYEILNNLEPGVQFEKDLKLCADKCDDGLTLDDVQAWRDSGFGKKSVDNNTAKTNAPTSNPFNR